MADRSQLAEFTRRQFVALATRTIGVLVADERARGAEAPGAAPHSGTARSTLSWGIWWESWSVERSFDALVRLLIAYRAAVDEIWFYDLPGANWHPSLEAYADTVELIDKRFKSLRRAGIPRVGVHVLTTIGHYDRYMTGAPPLPVPPMIGADGTIAKGSACPGRPEFHEYISAKYRLLSNSSVDFIVVGDDLRLVGHDPVVWGCFCDECLRRFGEEVGHSYHREALVKAFNEPHNLPLRQAWVTHNTRSIESVYATIGKSVHASNPTLQLGAEMLGISFTGYSGAAYDRWLAALQATRGRASGGFYQDTSVGQIVSNPPSPFGTDRMGLLTKAWDTSRQIAIYPAEVSDRRYELETHPDGCLGKEPSTVINEIAVALVAAGCNGADIRTFGGSLPYDEYSPLLDQVLRAREYLDSLRNHAAGLPAVGLYAAWSPHLFADRSVREGERWLADSPIILNLSYDFNLTLPASQMGVPTAMVRAEFGTILAGRQTEALPDEEIRLILGGGVVMDTVALEVLLARGFGDLVGVSIASTLPDFSVARLTADALNGSYAGTLLPFLGGPDEFPNTTLTAQGSNVRWLAELGDLREGIYQGPCIAAFENKIGGRVVVSGFAPWWFLNYASRRYQLLEIVDWISRGKAPVRIEEPIRLTPYVRLNADATRGVILLFNTGLSPIDVATVRIRVPKNVHLRLISVGKTLAFDRFDDKRGWGARIHNIPAWSTVAFLIG